MKSRTIDAFLPDPTTPEVTPETKAVFEENCRRGGHGDRIRLYEGLSVEALAWMIAGEGFWESFDVVFIDGSHLAKDVLSDAMQTWPLLRAGGMVIFDDYDWGHDRPAWQRPKEAIDAFEMLMGPFLKPVWKGYQGIFRKGA